MYDHHAPKRVIQTKNESIIRISQETRKLQYQTKIQRREARLYDDPARWLLYRKMRNKAVDSLRRDAKRTLSDKLDKKNPNSKWKAAKQLSGS